MKSKQHIAINIASDYNTLDPRKARSLNDYNLIKCFNEGLFRHDTNGVSKAITSSYFISTDQRYYVIKLKKTNWSNKDPLTAHDFIYAWKSALQKDFQAPFAYYLYYIKNGKEIKEGTLPSSALCASALDDYTIEIELTKPTPFFLELLSLPIFLPVHRQIDKHFPNWHYSSSHYVCNGPFYPKTVKKNDQFYPRPIYPKSLRKTEYITAIKNPHYWDFDNVPLSSIHMVLLNEDAAINLFQNKKLHFIGGPFSNLSKKAQHSPTSNTFPILATSWLRLNVNSFPLNNINVRKALGYTIRRQYISDKFFMGHLELATSIIPSNLTPTKKADFVDQDFNKAKVYLNMAFKELKQIRPLRLLFVNTQLNNNVANILKDTWKNVLNITIVLEPLEKKVFFQKLQNGDYDIAYSRKIADFKDPIDFLEAFKTKDSGLNSTGWENTAYQAAIDASYFASSSKKRMEICSEAEKILLNEMPVIPMHHLKMSYLIDKDLKGLIFSEVGIVDFKYAYLAETP
ncbi:peptide ABC transporter substrate-binding protein [bacterium]|nr:peptide ABC transporter substrate-binding protein [bacterium]